MRDAQGREITYLRISLTDLCNFRCVYCMPPQGVKKISHFDMLRFEEIIEIVALMSDRFGITKVRVTGGEPLVRRGVTGLLKDLCNIEGLEDVALTTNGYLLETMAEGIWDAGVKRLNISLDTLRRDRFEEYTRVDGLVQVLRGIEKAKSVGFAPIKVNVVAMDDNLDESGEFIAFGIEHGIEVRFIERMPFSADPRGRAVSNEEVMKKIGERFALSPIEDAQAEGSPAVRYSIDGTDATCGFISPLSAPFCGRCNRIRLRGDGKLLPCLQGITQYDLMPFIRPEFLTEKLARTIEEIVQHDLKKSGTGRDRLPMSQIGG